jgi:hypothetical protein
MITSKKFRISVTSIFILYAIALYIAYYPGYMVNDTQNIIMRAASGDYSGLQPVFLIALASLLLPFGAGVGAMYFLQFLAFIVGIGGLIFVLAGKNKPVSCMLILLCVTPYILTLLPFILKDTLILLLFLCYFAIYYFLLSANKNLLGVGALTLISVFILLSRYNAISTAPIMALAISYLFYNKKAFHLVKFLLSAAALLLLMIGSYLVIDQGIKHVVVFRGESAIGFLKGYDLVGISIQSGHKGVTGQLSEKLKRQLEKEYYGTQIFWGNKRKYSPPVNWVEHDTNKWVSQILKHPIAYLKHRTQTFAKLFDGTGQAPPSYKRNIWHAFKKHNYQPGLAYADSAAAKYLANNFLFLKFRKINDIFRKYPATYILPIFNVIILFVLFFLLYFKKIITNEGIIAIVMNSIAVFYYTPFYFFLHHPEIRYVYPSNCLILFSLPFALTYFIETRKQLLHMLLGKQERKA